VLGRSGRGLYDLVESTSVYETQIIPHTGTESQKGKLISGTAEFSASYDHRNRSIHSAASIHARRNRMDISNLSALNSEHVAVWHGRLTNRAVKARKAQIHVNNTHFLVNDVAAIGNLDRGRETEIARVRSHVSSPRIGTTL